jgi:hypothetical protein
MGTYHRMGCDGGSGTIMTSRIAIALLASLVVGCAPSDAAPPGAASTHGRPTHTAPTALGAAADENRSEGVLWEANHETGDTSEWAGSQSGTIFNSGTGKVEWTDEIARSGTGSLALSVRQASGETQAARIFRWAENPPEAYYSAWFYFPELVHPARWWNIFQFKSKLGDRTDPTWIVNVGTDSQGAMRLYLYDAITRTSHHDSVSSEPMVIPVGEWTHIEVLLRQATDDSGRIALWQDGRLLYELEGVQTTLADNVQWSLNNYSDALDPDDVTIFIDDAAIALDRQGTRP